MRINRIKRMSEIKPVDLRAFEVLPRNNPDPLFGVVIGHWAVMAQTGGVKKRNGNERYCLSKCGVIANYREWEIAYGRLPATCTACRPGITLPPECRTMQERDIQRLQILWSSVYMTSYIDQKSNIKADAATKEWNDLVLPFICSIIDRTRFGVKFGWKLFVRNCHFQKSKKSSPSHAHIKLIHESLYRIDMVVHAYGGEYSYEVDLTTPRRDVPFREIHASIVNALSGDVAPAAERVVDPHVTNPISNGKQVPATTTPPKAPYSAAPAATIPGKAPQEQTPSSNGAPVSPGPIDIARLMLLAKNIDTLLTVGKDVNELAQMKDAARKKVEEMNAKKGDAYIELTKTTEAANSAVVKERASKERTEQLEMQLRNALAALDNAKSEAADANAKMERAKAAYVPLEEAAKLAEQELKELEALEQDRLKQVGDAKGLAVLLEALSKLG